jgi:hypothetical protein
MKYDVVFWTFGNIDVERFIPVLAELNKKNLRTLLFYQDYNYRYGLSLTNQKLIDVFGINIMDFSFVLRENVLLKTADFFAGFFKRTRIRFLHNKFKGLCSRLIERRIDEALAEKILEDLAPVVNVFYPLYIKKETRYPYGCYFLKKMSREKGIPCFALQGGTFALQNGTKNGLNEEPGINGTTDFDKYFVPNIREMERTRRKHKGVNTDIVISGDPRFDLRWKNEIKDILGDGIEDKIKGMDIRRKFKVLFLVSSFECFGTASSKEKNLESVIKAIKVQKDSFLLIKPHPRYRAEDEIRVIAAKYDFHDFCILDDDPLLCYMRHVDLVISSFTSALIDTLPEWYDKVLIYDDFSKEMGLDNSFKDIFPFVETPEALCQFLEKKVNDGSRTNRGEHDKNINIDDFLRKWVAGGNDQDGIISGIADHIEEGIAQEKK